MGSSGTTSLSFGFIGGQGYQEDGDSGLMLLGHRYYDPATGRFLTRDSVKDGWNWYTYCANNPLRWIDPTGHILPFLIALVGVIIVVAVIVVNVGEVRRGAKPGAAVGSGGTGPTYIAPPGGGEVGGVAPAAGPLTAIAKERRARKQHMRNLENPDSPDDHYDQDNNDSTGSKDIKRVLGGLSSGRRTYRLISWIFGHWSNLEYFKIQIA